MLTYTGSFFIRHHITTCHQVLRLSLSFEKRPTEVPNEHFAVYIGQNVKRSVLLFQILLRFKNCYFKPKKNMVLIIPISVLIIPCSEDLFVDLTFALSST
ncbi:hypothetical protein PHJA_001052000 [Phtheirospermum japonicum]|uniref:Uncharacterized protein n=1 Tax=Phtheirospermum japonicum TaxID=374723 RepID=A0A830BZ35_9LAMI|nr:hypothetical protein PHJA_001052000 [Phtheirospermum japonicum]